MKKLLLIIFLGISTIAISQKTWVTFTSSNPSEAIFTLQSSSNSEVIYTVEVPGMFQESVTQDTIIYQRLSIPKSSIWGYSGDPGLPAVVKRFAVPECNSIDITFNATDSVVLNDYNVYPQPYLIEDTVNGILQEVFTKNDSVYGLNIMMPENNYKILQDGHLRNQRILKLATYPIKYNPVTRQIIAYTQFELTLTFINATSALNIDNGLFNGVTKGTTLNYDLDRNIPPPPQIQNVQWITLSDTAEAKDIVADYLIITAGQFFTPPSSNLAQFANHRALKSGYCVGIVSVMNIVSYPFYSDPNFPQYINEQKIRSFIKRVYEGAHAQHTIDGRVAFVLLVGDANGNDINNLWVPTSKDPDPTGQVFNNQLVHYSDNDYYYSCVTIGTNGHFDLDPDLFIGRFSADNETELHNIVKKTKEYENEILSGKSNGEWRKKNLLAYGLAGEQGIYYTNYFCTDLVNWLNELLPPEPPNPTISLDGTGNIEWNHEYIDLLNNQGYNLVIDYGHGKPYAWCHYSSDNPDYGALTLDFKKAELNNPGMYPFAIANACNTAKFDFDAGIGPDCIAEEMTVYSDTAGYVASLGSWPTVGLPYYSDPGQFPAFWYETIPYAIFNNLSSLLGECVLEGEILSEPHNPWPFQYILFGDPALNLMSAGYELTHNVPFCGTLKVSTPTYVRENATLTLCNGSIVDFENNGQLIIEGKLVIGDNVEFRGRNMDNVVRVTGIVEGFFFGPNPPDPIPINNINCSAYPGTDWKGFEFENPALEVTFNDGYIANCSLTGSLEKLELNNIVELASSKVEINETNLLISNSNFSNTNVILNNYQDLPISVTITNSSFTNSPDEVILSIDHYPDFLIEDNDIFYERGTGISVSYCGGGTIQHSINNNTIQKSGSSTDLSWGIQIYHSFADINNNFITNNKYGIVGMNQSSVTILGNSAAQQDDQTQRIINNYQNQVKCFDNSFPYELHYNIIDNSNNNALVYYQRSAIPEEDPPLPDGSLNIKCNCLPANPVFYPANGYTWTPTWCPGDPFCDSGIPGKDLFEQAVLSMDSGNYITAENQFKELVVTYPGSEYAKESIKKMIPLKKLSDNDFEGLKIYYDTTAILHEDSLMENLVYRLKNRCDVEQKAFEDAITWYENDILNPASLADSVYSMIDLSDTYLLMAADSMTDAGNSNYTGILNQYKPKNLIQYRKNRDEWIKLLFNELTDDDDKPGDKLTDGLETILSQNHPNPFVSETTIEYVVKEKGDILIEVTSVFGQVLLRLNKSNLSPGQYSETINLNDYPDGLYFFSLYMNNQNVARIKGIKMH